VAVVTTLVTIFLIENEIIIKTVPRISIDNTNNEKLNDNYLSFILMLTNIINSRFNNIKFYIENTLLFVFC
jgi:hypothetical protein